MSADIYIFPTMAVERCGGTAAPGNGARDALIDIAKSLPNDTGQNDAEKWSDWILIELCNRGFMVAPNPTEKTS